MIVALLIFACVFAAAAIGMGLRAALPAHHLNPDSRDIVKMSTGLVGTMAALLLGLLIASSKGTYDQAKSELIEISANVLLLDRLLAHYGPEATDIRQELRQTVISFADRIWTRDHTFSSHKPIIAPQADRLFDLVHHLKPLNDEQRAILSEAQGILLSVGHSRMLLAQQAGRSISMPFLIVVVAWLAIIFMSFGLLAPRNGTVIVTLLVCALSVAAAMFLFLELDKPFSGTIQLSRAPVQNAIDLIGK